MIKHKTVSKYRQLKPHLYKLNGKWDYEPAFGHELQAYANNYMAAECCYHTNRKEKLRKARRTKCISTLNNASA